MITRRIQLDVSKPGSQLALYARQGDARVYDVRVSLCEQSAPISVPGDWTAVLQARKPDGKMLCDTALVEGGEIRAYLGTQAFTAAGVMRCELYVFDQANGQALYSPSFDVYVEAPALTDGDIESSDSFGALMTAMQAVDGYDATLRGLISDMEQAKGAALEAVGEATASASGAAEAGQAALAAAAGAEASAAKLDNMTIDAVPVAPGGAPTAAVSEVDGHKHVELGIPAGATGPQGPGYTVKGRAYATAGELEAAVPTPAEGDQYNVGAAPPYRVYRWTGDAWEDQGQVQGQPGRDGVSPQAGVSKEGRAATITITDADGTTTATVTDGASAYELAVAQGYAGTLDEWLSTLHGGNDNLLDNSDFRAGWVVNQRGQAAYTSNQNTIDRWTLYASDSPSLTMGGGGMTMSGTEAVLYQMIPNMSLTGAYTAAIMADDGLHLVSGTPPVTGDGVYIATADGCLAVGISLAGHEIRWAALYEGIYTAETLPGYAPKGYAAELSECQRYFKRIPKTADASFHGFCASATQARITIPGAGAMRVTPTLTFHENFASAYSYLYQGTSLTVPTSVGSVGDAGDLTVILYATGLTPNAPCVFRPNCVIDISAEL